MLLSHADRLQGADRPRKWLIPITADTQASKYSRTQHQSCDNQSISTEQPPSYNDTHATPASVTTAPTRQSKTSSTIPTTLRNLKPPTHVADPNSVLSVSPARSQSGRQAMLPQLRDQSRINTCLDQNTVVTWAAKRHVFISQRFGVMSKMDAGGNEPSRQRKRGRGPRSAIGWA